MMGDDAAGSLLAQRIRRAPLDAWDVLDGGFAPENVLYLIRELAPEQVLVMMPPIWTWFPARSGLSVRRNSRIRS